MPGLTHNFRRYLATPLLVLAIVFAACVFATPPDYARAVWTVDSGTVDAKLNTVTFVDPTTGFAAGESGTILKTVDGGLSWRLVHQAPDHNITGIGFRDASAGWAVTFAGAVFATTNSGESWNPVSTDLAGGFYVAETIYDLAVAGTSTIMAVGGAQEIQPAVWESRNGHGDWGLAVLLAGSYDPPPDADPFPKDGLGVFYGIDAVTPSRVWAVGIDFLREPHRAVVWRFDGGNWSEQSFAGGSLPFYDLSFSDESRGVAVGAQGRIRRTVDGGATWEPSGSGTFSDLRAVSIVRGGTSGFAVGSGGVILRTPDAGLSWTTTQPLLAHVNFEDVYAIDSNTAVAVGNSGHIFRTSDGGLTWSAPPAPQPPLPLRVSGRDRFLTAIEAAKVTFGSSEMNPGPDGRRTVIIASGRNWPDALAASGLAGALDAPLLLTEPASLPVEVATYIGQLKADRAIIVGGSGAVSDSVRDTLIRLLGWDNVRRLGGVNRYETTHQIASATVSPPRSTPWDGTAFVATGLNFPDALAAAPLAAARGVPIYLAPNTGISSTTILEMKKAGVRRVYLLGGTGVVSGVTESRINGANIEVAGRLGGDDRFATARAIAEHSLGEGLSISRVALATGRDFPDALAGGVLQGHTGSVLLLTESSVLHEDARTVLHRNVGKIKEIRLIGGEMVLTEHVREQAVSAASP